MLFLYIKVYINFRLKFVISLVILQNIFFDSPTLSQRVFRWLRHQQGKFMAIIKALFFIYNAIPKNKCLLLVIISIVDELVNRNHNSKWY